MRRYCDCFRANLPKHLNDDRELLCVEGLNVLKELSLRCEKGWTRSHRGEILLRHLCNTYT